MNHYNSAIGKVKIRMSHHLSFKTSIKSVQLLHTAVDMLRSKGKNIEGPTFDERCRTKQFGITPGYKVKLPGWQKFITFLCNEAGDADADNYSPYYDYRKVNPQSGKLEGDCHAEVLKYEETNGAEGKRVGEDGRWGDIAELDALNNECVRLSFEETAHQRGDFITDQAFNEDGSIDFVINHA